MYSTPASAWDSTLPNVLYGTSIVGRERGDFQAPTASMRLLDAAAIHQAIGLPMAGSFQLASLRRAFTATHAPGER
jgi:hypothetical protein